MLIHAVREGRRFVILCRIFASIVGLVCLAQALPVAATGGPERHEGLSEAVNENTTLVAELWAERWGLKLDHNELMMTKYNLAEYLPAFNSEEFLESDPDAALALWRSHLEQLEGIKTSLGINRELFLNYACWTHGPDSFAYRYYCEAINKIWSDVNAQIVKINFTKLGRSIMHKKVGKMIRIIPASLYPSSFRMAWGPTGPSPVGAGDMPTALYSGTSPELYPDVEEKTSDALDLKIDKNLTRYQLNIEDIYKEINTNVEKFNAQRSPDFDYTELTLTFKELLTKIDDCQFAVSHIGDQFWKRLSETQGPDCAYNMEQIKFAREILLDVTMLNHLLTTSRLAVRLMQEQEGKSTALLPRVAVPSLSSLGPADPVPVGVPVEPLTLLPEAGSKDPSKTEGEALAESKAPVDPPSRHGAKALVQREDDEALVRYRSDLRCFDSGMGEAMADFNETDLDEEIQTSRLWRLGSKLELIDLFGEEIGIIRTGYAGKTLKNPSRNYLYNASQVKLADALLKELEQFKRLLLATRLGCLRMREEVGKRIQVLSQSYPELVAQSQRASAERSREKAMEKRQLEELDRARQKRVAAGQERKVEQKRANAVFERSRQELEGTIREQTAEEAQADKDFQLLFEQDKRTFRRRRAEPGPSTSALSSSSSPSSSSSSSSDPAPSAGPQVTPVKWLPEARVEDFAENVIKDIQLRRAINTSIEKLRQTGRLSGSKQVAPGIYELRPRGGQSTWRPLYTLHDGCFIILALTRESVENPSCFKAGLNKALIRLHALRQRTEG